MDQITDQEKQAETPPIRYELIIRDTVTGHAVGAAANHLYDFLKPLSGPFKADNPGVKSQIHLMFRYFRKEVAAIESSKIGPEENELRPPEQQGTEQGPTQEPGPETEGSSVPSSGDSGPEPISGK